MFESTMAGTGLSLAAAKRAGLDAISVIIITLDRAHFFPDKDLMTLELVVEKGTRRILGVQGIAGHGDTLVGKVNTVAVMLPEAHGGGHLPGRDSLFPAVRLGHGHSERTGQRCRTTP